MMSQEREPLGPGRLAEEVDSVQWVTREHPKTDRIACPWLIRRFIDPHAEILYVPADQVLAADYHVDDPAVALLARIVHGADIPADLASTPQSAGLQAMADGFAVLGLDDQRQLELELPVYDALYAWCQRHAATTG